MILRAVRADAKLVRDRIPEIIRADGLQPVIHAVGDAEASLEELADVLEVVRALISEIGFDPERLEAARATKAERNGAFNQRYLWYGRPLRPAASPVVADDQPLRRDTPYTACRTPDDALVPRASGVP